MRARVADAVRIGSSKSTRYFDTVVSTFWALSSVHSICQLHSILACHLAYPTYIQSRIEHSIQSNISLVLEAESQRGWYWLFFLRLRGMSIFLL